MAVKTMVVAKQCVQECHPRVHATKHNDQVGRLSHWCVWTRAFNGRRLSTGDYIEPAVSVDSERGLDMLCGVLGDSR